MLGLRHGTREEAEVSKVNLVSFSGGRTSAYLVWLMEQKRKNEGWYVAYVFMDTGAEHPATYQFIRDIVNHWGIDLTCLRVRYNPNLGTGNSYDVVSVNDIGPDLAPWKGMVNKYGSPSAVAPYCTTRMKTDPHNKWANDIYGKDGYITWLGIRADEPRRLKSVEGIKFLAEISDMEKPDILQWWEAQPFDLGIEEHLGNCVFCIKKSLNKLGLAIKDEERLAAEFIEMSEGDEVRVTGRKHNHKKMYRKMLHLSDIKQMYAEEPRDELYKRLRFTKQFDTGSCTESCEVFNLEDDTNQIQEGGERREEEVENTET